MMMTRCLRLSTLIAGVALAASVGGCGSRQAAPDMLGEICKVRPCACQDPDAALFTKPAEVPIQWSEGGVPSCPPGYELRRVKP
jgi:hypothetical protein